MKDEKMMMYSLMECQKELETKYKANLKKIKKEVKNKAERDAEIQNLNDQYIASKLALERLLVSKKINVAVAANA